MGRHGAVLPMGYYDSHPHLAPVQLPQRAWGRGGGVLGQVTGRGRERGMSGSLVRLLRGIRNDILLLCLDLILVLGVGAVSVVLLLQQL